MGVPEFIEDEIYQAVRNREALRRVRELAKAYDVSGDQVLWRVAQDIYKALEGK